jgi:hypothetical protein
MASYNDHFRAQELTKLQGPEKPHPPPPPHCLTMNVVYQVFLASGSNFFSISMQIFYYVELCSVT